MDNYYKKKIMKKTFDNLFYNCIINKFLRKNKFKMKQILFQVLKNFTLINLTNKLKKMSLNSKVNSFRKNKLKLKIKLYLNNLRRDLKIRNSKSLYFRNTILKIKIYKLLYNFNLKSRISNNNIIENFTQFRQKISIFSLLKKFYFIVKRENYILNNLRQMYKEKKLRLMRNCIDDWKKFYISQKFRKAKLKTIIIQFFIVLKVSSKRHNIVK